MAFAGLGLDRLHLVIEFYESAAAVALLKTALNFPIPKLSGNVIRFSGNCKDIPKVSFIVGPSVVAFVASGNGDSLHLRIPFG
jgi:hypothetical protein